MVDVIVREAQERDAGGVAKLLNQLGYPNSPEQVAHRLPTLAEAADYGAFVAEVDGQIVGVAAFHVVRFFEKAGRWCRLTALVVRKGMRGQGIGRRLVERVEAEARTLGCEQLELNSGDQRVDAHAFYEHLGYERVSQRFRKQL